jgi:transketolase
MEQAKRATRQGFGDQLLESGEKNQNIVVLTADLGEATHVHAFGQKWPDRFLDCGICEANMIGVAAGVADHGKRVFCTSFATFLTGRYDQIRTSIAYAKAPVVLVGTHAGLAIGRDGAVHQSLEDLALMRALPNMEVMQPATYNEARAIVRWLCEVPKLYRPVYLRLGRQPVEEVFDWEVLNGGKIMLIRDRRYTRTDVAIFSSGCVLSESLACQAELRANGVNVDLYNVSTLKPIDKEGINLAAMSVGRIITIEDHSVIGGLGSAVLEALEEDTMRPVLRIGVDDVFAESGKPEDLYEKYGLSQKKIMERILAWI